MSLSLTLQLALVMTCAALHSVVTICSTTRDGSLVVVFRLVSRLSVSFFAELLSSVVSTSRPRHPQSTTSQSSTTVTTVMSLCRVLRVALTPPPRCCRAAAAPPLLLRVCDDCTSSRELGNVLYSKLYNLPLVVQCAH